MKRTITFLLIGLFMMTALPVYAQKGASERAQEKASDQAIFHRVTDWFATIGKSGEEKEKILDERRAERAAQKAEKKAQKAKKKAEEKRKEAEETAKEAEETAEKAGKEMKSEAGEMKGKMQGMKGMKKGS